MFERERHTEKERKRKGREKGERKGEERERRRGVRKRRAHVWNRTTSDGKTASTSHCGSSLSKEVGACTWNPMISVMHKKKVTASQT